MEFARARILEDADARHGTRLAYPDFIGAEAKAVVAASDRDRRGAFRSPAVAVVHDAVLLEDIAVGAHGLRFFPEEHARSGVALDHVFPKQVVAVLVADGYPNSLVVP